MLEGEGDNVKPRKRREGTILQQGDMLGEQGDHFGLNLEGKDVITSKQMSSG